MLGYENEEREKWCKFAPNKQELFNMESEKRKKIYS